MLWGFKYLILISDVVIINFKKYATFVFIDGMTRKKSPVSRSHDY